MSNLEDLDYKYKSILHKISLLRSQGLSDSNSEIIKAKRDLRDILDLKKRNANTIIKTVPRLTGIKTVAISEDKFNGVDFRNKYTMLGVVIGICALLYFIFSGSDRE